MRISDWSSDVCSSDLLHGLFEMMGFTAVARHRRKDVTLFRQNDINFLVNATPYTHFQQFAHAHGPSACAMGWRVADGPAAHAHALAQGAVAFDTKPGLMELNLPEIGRATCRERVCQYV